MRAVFADAGYWVAIASSRDRLHVKAAAVAEQLGECRVVTSEMVLWTTCSLRNLVEELAKRGHEVCPTPVRSLSRLATNPGLSGTPKPCRECRVDRDKSWIAPIRVAAGKKTRNRLPIDVDDLAMPVDFQSASGCIGSPRVTGSIRVQRPGEPWHTLSRRVCQCDRDWSS
jgi:hypothetical protein